MGDEIKWTDSPLSPPLEWKPTGMSTKPAHVSWDNFKAERRWERSLPPADPANPPEYPLAALTAALIAEREGDWALVASCAREAAAAILAVQTEPVDYDRTYNLDNHSTRDLLRTSIKRLLDAEEGRRFAEIPYVVSWLREVCERNL